MIIMCTGILLLDDFLYSRAKHNIIIYIYNAHLCKYAFANGKSINTVNLNFKKSTTKKMLIRSIYLTDQYTHTTLHTTIVRVCRPLAFRL